MDHDLDVTPFLTNNSMGNRYEPVGMSVKLWDDSHQILYECPFSCLPNWEIALCYKDYCGFLGYVIGR